jgi:hypothetical protein
MEIPVISRWPVPVVLMASGALGWYLGVGAFADWQVAVESAQVVAGLVAYPAGNPFYVYHTKLWTILHQILALPLTAGVSERTLSILVSGALGMVSFQALSLIAYAIGRDVLLAIGAATLIFFSRAAEVGGSVYPVWLVGTTHTYGILALSYAALVVGLLGCGWRRTGLFLLGAAPAVHPSIGAWLVVIAALVFVSDARRIGRELQPALSAFAAGGAVTLASLAIQLLFIQDVPRVDSTTSAKYLAAFASFWDSHRQPVDLASAPVRVNAAALVLAAVWLWRRGLELAVPVQLVLRFVAASGALSLVLAAASQIPPDRLPAWFVIAMPGRMLNLNLLLWSAVLVGLAARYRRAGAGGPVLLLVTLALLFGNRSGLWTFGEFGQPPLGGLPASLRPNATTVLIVGPALVFLVASLARRSGRFAHGWHASTVAVLTVSALLMAMLERPVWFDMTDWHDDQLFRHLSQQSGLLLSGGDLHLIQLRSRRPVLLDGGGLDALPYATEAAPEMERILRRVYGIELLNPPEEARLRGTIPPELTRRIWEAYSPDEWQRIATEFGVRQVVTPHDWTLQLPLEVRSRTLSVYDIGVSR